MSASDRQRQDLPRERVIEKLRKRAKREIEQCAPPQQGKTTQVRPVEWRPPAPMERDQLAFSASNQIVIGDSFAVGNGNSFASETIEISAAELQPTEAFAMQPGSNAATESIDIQSPAVSQPEQVVFADTLLNESDDRLLFGAQSLELDPINEYELASGNWPAPDAIDIRQSPQYDLESLEKIGGGEPTIQLDEFSIARPPEFVAQKPSFAPGKKPRRQPVRFEHSPGFENHSDELTEGQIINHYHVDLDSGHLGEELAERILDELNHEITPEIVAMNRQINNVLLHQIDAMRAESRRSASHAEFMHPRI